MVDGPPKQIANTIATLVVDNGMAGERLAKAELLLPILLQVESQVVALSPFNIFLDHSLDHPACLSLHQAGAPYDMCPHNPVCIYQILRDRYQILQKLGSGRYSTVWLARDQR